uniref:Retrotransposon gag domain-containing protein n=1 Tax=Magallana gigas TaxID=29159 RepID=A0A8W8LL28_MAGGI
MFICSSQYNELQQGRILYQGRAAGSTKDNIDLLNGAIAVNQKMIHQMVTVPILHLCQQADYPEWDNEEILRQILPRIQGTAADFTYGQLKATTLKNYREFIKELNSRYGEIESCKSYRTKFNYRRQLEYGSPEEFAAELKRLYDKVHPTRNTRTRREDLVSHFLAGLNDDQARFYVELNKDLKTLDDAVLHVVQRSLEKTHEILEENGLTDNGMESAKKLDGQRTWDIKKKNVSHTIYMNLTKIKVLKEYVREVFLEMQLPKRFEEDLSYSRNFSRNYLFKRVKTFREPKEVARMARQELPSKEEAEDPDGSGNESIRLI